MTDKRELQKAYQLMQSNCGIDIGDAVKVLRDPKDQEMGWMFNRATFGFSSDVGKVTNIESSLGVSVYFESAKAAFWFPFFVLEKIPKPHWRITVSEENPVLCFVRDNTDSNWFTDYQVIKNFTDSYYSYKTMGNDGYRYAKRVPREMVEKLLAGYDETSEDEQCGLN